MIRVYADTAVAVEAAGIRIEADLTVPEGARGVVLFAHGSGSSRHSQRNRLVAEHLHEHRLATVRADLLTPEEAAHDAETGALRFDIALLGARMTALVDWAVGTEPVRRAKIGLFGASTGAAAALVAAAERPAEVSAVVSRGGRPDLAGEALAQVRAVTLLLVGERDQSVLGLNERAAVEMRAPCRIEVVRGAGHLFEEPGTLLQVADHAAGWFATHLVPSG